jgi:hypothetical protein
MQVQELGLAISEIQPTLKKKKVKPAAQVDRL